MSFLKLCHFIDSSHSKYELKTIIKDKIITSLQAQLRFVQKVAYTDTYKNNSKRMSLVYSKKISAGITIEAAFAIPIFLFFMINLISMINIFNTYSEKLSQVQQTARTIALSTFTLGGIGDDIVSDTKIVSMLPWTEEVGYNPAVTSVTMSYRKWNGYDVTTNTGDKETEEYVYITDYGYSYHKNRGCSHINIAIEVIDKQNIDFKRNNSGGKYYSCEKCGGNSSGILFITSDGDRYHSKANCSGLKRSVKAVKLSEVGDRSPCSACGR